MATAKEQVLVYRLGRRKRIAILHTIETATQFVNLVFYLAPNVYVLLNPCDIFVKNFLYWAGFVRWTCFNTVRLGITCFITYRFQELLPNFDVQPLYHAFQMYQSIPPVLACIGADMRMPC